MNEGFTKMRVTESILRSLTHQDLRKLYLWTIYRLHLTLGKLYLDPPVSGPVFRSVIGGERFLVCIALY